MGSMMNGVDGGNWAWMTLRVLTVVASSAALLSAMNLAWPRRRAVVSSSHSPRSTALAELDLRYARGEMDHEQYVAQRAEFRSGLLGPGCRLVAASGRARLTGR